MTPEDAPSRRRLMRLYVDMISGNCLKVLWTADYLGIPYERVDLDIRKGETRTEDFLAINPFGQTPCAVFPDGRALTQSNAIVMHLAESAQSALLPVDSFARAEVYAWMFWEQNSHEPYIAGRRFRKTYLGRADEAIDPEWLPRGFAALDRLEARLRRSEFLVGEALTLADIVLLPYTRSAGEGGFDLSPFVAVRGWIARTEAAIGATPLEASRN